MGRIRQSIDVHGKQFWTLFECGARNSYVTPALARLLTTTKLRQPFRTALGGDTKTASRMAILEADIEGRPIATDALVLKQIGRDEDGRPIEVLFGALAMQQWGIRLVPEEERLDLSHYPKEFVEF